MTAIEQFNQTSLIEQAKLLSQSGIVPKAFRGKPADVLAAILWGSELGLGAMASMSFIDVIDGNPTLNTEGRVALVRKAGHSIVIKATATEATVTGKRRDSGDEQTVTWTMDMAKRAGLAGKQVWKSYPEAMLTSRALSQLCRNLFADVTGGLSYAPEETASWAAPEVLDAEPAELAAQTVGVEQAALPAPAPVEIVESAPPATVTGSTSGERSTGIASPTGPRRTFAPPSQSKQNTQRIMAEFTEADEKLASPDELKALHKEIDSLDLEAATELSAAWKTAGLPSIKNKKTYDKAAYEQAMGLVLDAKEAMEVRAHEGRPFTDDEQVSA